MITKKLLLFSAPLLLLTALSAMGQQSSSTVTTTPGAQQGSTSVRVATGGSSYLGIATAEVTRENMSRYNLREPRGLVVLRVSDDSPAARAGVRTGDVILKFDGEQVTTYSKLQRLINETAPEQNVRLTISRDGREQEISVTMGRRRSGFQDLVQIYPRQDGEARRALERMQRDQGMLAFGWGRRRIGVGTTQLTKQLADYFGVAGGHGLLVTSVTENSPAARAGLKAGDIITAADGEKVENSGDLSRVINRKEDGAVNLTIMRDRNQMNLSVTPEKREPGAMTISPELFQIEMGALEIEFPTIDIQMPQIMPQIKMKPITISPIKIAPIKIKPMKFPKLEKLLEMTETL
jgi:serine protease Do